MNIPLGYPSNDVVVRPPKDSNQIGGLDGGAGWNRSISRMVGVGQQSDIRKNSDSVRFVTSARSVSGQTVINAGGTDPSDDVDGERPLSQRHPCHQQQIPFPKELSFQADSRDRDGLSASIRSLRIGIVARAQQQADGHTGEVERGAQTVGEITKI